MFNYHHYSIWVISHMLMWVFLCEVICARPKIWAFWYTTQQSRLVSFFQYVLKHINIIKNICDIKTTLYEHWRPKIMFFVFLLPTSKKPLKYLRKNLFRTNNLEFNVFRIKEARNTHPHQLFFGSQKIRIVKYKVGFNEDLI